MSRDGAGRGPVARSHPSPCHGPAQKDEHKRQLERLRAELEAEQLHAQELRRCFAAETRELKEAAEQDRQLLAEWLHSRWEQRQARELQRLRELNRQQRAVEIRQLLRSKEAELRKVQGMLLQQRDDAIRHARDLQQQLAKKLLRGDWSSSKARRKLHDVLSKLRWETKGKHAAHIHRLEDELLLQRRCFLNYILERFEGEQPSNGKEARAKATAWHRLQTLLGTRAMEPCLDAPPQGRTGSGQSVAEVGVQTVGQQEDWLPGSSHSRLLEQNAHLQSALKDLERRCSVLQEENCLLRKASSPEVRQEWERLKQKTVKLGLISKQLQERARQLQNIGRMINTRVPLPIQSSTEELRLTSFPQQRAGERGEPAGALLACDEQDDLSEKAAEELQAQAAADEEDSSHVSTHSPTCEELQVQLTEMTNANTQLAEENARLCGQMGLTERATKASGRGARFCHPNKRLSANPAGRGKAQTESHERNGRQKSRAGEGRRGDKVSAPEERGGRRVFAESPQTEVRREQKETLPFFQAQVAELNDRCQKPKEHHQQLFQELERLERERSNCISSRPHQAKLGVDKESILLEATRKPPAELRPFIARYSDDPFDGPNERPGLELPLVAGRCFYVFGDVDEDRWYVGELTEGTRGFVPSNFVEVSDDDLMTPASPETSDW